MSKHILQTISPTEKDFDFDVAVKKCSEWLIATLAPKQCFRPGESRKCRCHCLAFLLDDEATTIAVARYMVSWAGFGMKQRMRILNTWQRYADHTKGMFILPLDYENATDW